MSNLVGFRPDDVEVPDDEFGDEPLLPEGKYKAMCVRIFNTENAAGRPSVAYTWQIIGGPHNDAQITNWEYPPCEGRSEQAAQIYNRKLKSLMKICGCGEELLSEDELMNKPLIINIKHKDGYDGQTNSINYYKRDDGKAPVQAAKPKTAPKPQIKAFSPSQPQGVEVKQPPKAPPKAPAPAAREPGEDDEAESDDIPW